MKAYWIGSVGGTQIEHSNVRCVLLVAWIGSEDISTREVQPGDNDDAVSFPEVLDGPADIWIEDKPSVRRPFATLTRCVSWIDQGRFNVPDRLEHIA